MLAMPSNMHPEYFSAGDACMRRVTFALYHDPDQKDPAGTQVHYASCSEQVDKLRSRLTQQGYTVKNVEIPEFKETVKQSLSGPMVSLLVEVPEELHESLQRYLDTHPQWSQERVLCAALSLFLMQNGAGDRRINRIYLDTLFDFAA